MTKKYSFLAHISNERFPKNTNPRQEVMSFSYSIRKNNICFFSMKKAGGVQGSVNPNKRKIYTAKYIVKVDII